MQPPAVAIVDIETSGLDHTKHVILELGIALYDLSLNEIATFSTLVADRNSVAHLQWLENLYNEAREDLSLRSQEPWKGARIVHEMHQKNGLADEIRAVVAGGEEITLADAAFSAVAWLDSYGISQKKNALPMTGSTILFDRMFIQSQMPALNEAFHYRNIDISSIKGIVDMYRDDIVQTRHAELIPARTHRVLSDCKDSVEELEFYLKHFFVKGN